jgi:hypothetical protein
MAVYPAARASSQAHRCRWIEREEKAMKDLRRVDLRQAGEWLSGEVEIRIGKRWLIGAGVLVAVLVLLALD